jgi:hypothetical protein
MKTMLIAVTALLLCAAADVRATMYDVEILVFRPLDPFDDGELWPQEPGRPDIEQAVEIQPGGTMSPLSPTSFRLSDVEGALRLSRGYRPLFHLAWTQPGLGTGRAMPVHIISGETPDGTIIEGTVTLARERYLHLYVDLVMYSDDGLTPPFRLAAHRRMRSRELHYIDHPRFGVLAIVTPRYAPGEAEVAEPEAPATESGGEEPAADEAGAD